MWAGNSIVGKLAVGHASPMILITIRWLVVMVALYVLKRQQIAADWPAIRPRLAYLLFMGALGFTGFSVALYYALVYTTAINASILQGSMPLFVFCASFILFGSRVGREYYADYVSWLSAFDQLGLRMLLNQHVTITHAGRARGGIERKSADPAQPLSYWRRSQCTRRGEPAAVGSYARRADSRAACADTTGQ